MQLLDAVFGERDLAQDWKISSMVSAYPATSCSSAVAKDLTPDWRAAAPLRGRRACHAPLNSSNSAMRFRISGVIWREFARIVTPNTIRSGWSVGAYFRSSETGMKTRPPMRRVGRRRNAATIRAHHRARPRTWKSHHQRRRTTNGYEQKHLEATLPPVGRRRPPCAPRQRTWRVVRIALRKGLLAIARGDRGSEDFYQCVDFNECIGGDNRLEAGNERFLRERSSEPLGPVFCAVYREVHGEA